MAVQARFYVASVTKNAYNPGAAEVTLQAVSRGDHNKHWCAATPSGSIKLTINNGHAAKYFEDALGEDVQVVMTLVKAAVPGDGHAFRLADIAEGIYGHGNCGECGRPEDQHQS